jgi:hypothetical protein
VVPYRLVHAETYEPAEQQLAIQLLLNWRSERTIKCMQQQCRSTYSGGIERRPEAESIASNAAFNNRESTFSACISQGDDSHVLSPQTGFPAITVPIGFTMSTCLRASRS